MKTQTIYETPIMFVLVVCALGQHSWIDSNFKTFLNLKEIERLLQLNSNWKFETLQL